MRQNDFYLKKYRIQKEKILAMFLLRKLYTAQILFLASIKARFHYERGKKHSLFVLLLFFCARFNRRSIKERKNALFHARSGNGP